jgi:hypothetical protein
VSEDALEESMTTWIVVRYCEFPYYRYLKVTVQYFIITIQLSDMATLNTKHTVQVLQRRNTISGSLARQTGLIHLYFELHAESWRRTFTDAQTPTLETGRLERAHGSLLSHAK